MSTSRFAAVVVVLALLSGACGDDGDSSRSTDGTPSTDPTSDPSSPGVVADTASSLPAATDAPATTATLGTTADELPPLIVADGRSIVRFNADAVGTPSVEPILATVAPVHRMVATSDGSIFVVEVTTRDEDTAREVVRYRPDGERSLVEEMGDVYDVAMIDGVEVVIGAIADPEGYRFGGVGAFAVDDFRMVADFGLAAEAEFGVTHFMWSDDMSVGVASAWADLTEWVGFVDTQGETVEWPSPTDDLQYAAPPYVTAATISPDGRSLWWVEGPDWGFDDVAGTDGPVAAPWVLHGADLETGAEFVVWPLSSAVLDASELDMHSIVDLGDRVLINRTALVGVETVALAPLLLDLTLEEPELTELAIIGIASPAP